MTTIKVSRDTRDAVNRRAAVAHKTADEYLSGLMVEEEWRARMAQARCDMAAVDSEYVADIDGWDDSVAADGLA